MVIVNDFHKVQRRVRRVMMKKTAASVLPISMSRSMMRSVFMGQSYTTTYFPELLTLNLLRATYRIASQAWLKESIGTPVFLPSLSVAQV